MMQYDSVWRRMADCPLPLVMYGTGDGADRICDMLNHFGREPAAFFASEERVRPGRIFRGKPIKSYNEVCRDFPEFAVVLGFGSDLPDVVLRINDLSRRHKLFVPEIALSPDSEDPGNDIFTSKTALKYRNEISACRALWADSQSRRLFDAILRFRISGDIADIAGTASQDMYLPLYHSKKSYKTAADLGANRGQTSLELLMRFPMLSRVIAMEPDMTNFRKLGAAVRQDSRIEPYNIAAWDENAQITVFGDGSRGSSADRADKSKNRRFRPTNIRAAAFDSIIDGDCDLLHIDVEGSELRALKGAMETISRCQPDIMLAVYHRMTDLFLLPLLIRRLMPEKSLYLRRPDSYPAWDLTLTAISRTQC